MDLDRLRRHEELLGDLPVGAARGGEVGNPLFRRGQRAGSAERLSPRSRTGGTELGAGALDQRGRAADRCEFQPRCSGSRASVGRRSRRTATPSANSALASSRRICEPSSTSTASSSVAIPGRARRFQARATRGRSVRRAPIAGGASSASASPAASCETLEPDQDLGQIGPPRISGGVIEAVAVVAKLLGRRERVVETPLGNEHLDLRAAPEVAGDTARSLAHRSGDVERGPGGGDSPRSTRI